MRFRERLLRRLLSVSPAQSPVRIGTGLRIAQARNILDLSDNSRHACKRRSQYIFES
jgi:hypothetical protein